MSNVPDDRVYSPQHIWLKMQDSVIAIIGITEFAQSELGDIVYIEPPDLDREYQAGQVCAVVESVKTASDVYMPVNGRVIEVNGDLLDAPEMLNELPYENGWLCKIELPIDTAIDSLLDASQYEEYIAS
ncbi:MAG: glycine cleavage system protein GcvH [Gammaproteobacteria bacterium]|nr:glycine cleavage system protein GcvH [Gammaproteobacteria bacterium]